MNFKEHNEEVRRVWKAYHAGKPIRIPVMAGIGSRFYMMNPEYNTKGFTYEKCIKNPDLMFEMQANFDRVRRFHVVADHMMGYPEEEGGWSIAVDFQNCFETAWYGSEIKYPSNECPYPAPLLNDDNKEMLFEKGIPDPFGGFCQMGKEYYERFLELKKDFILDGYPVANISVPFTSTDGPFTIACDLMGAAKACILLLEEPEYMEQLFSYITDATIQRVKAWRKYLGQPERSKSYGLCDDSIMLLSHDMYMEFILPHHKKLYSSLSTMEEPSLI